MKIQQRRIILGIIFAAFIFWLFWTGVKVWYIKKSE